MGGEVTDERKPVRRTPVGGIPRMPTGSERDHRRDHHANRPGVIDATAPTGVPEAWEGGTVHRTGVTDARGLESPTVTLVRRSERTVNDIATLLEQNAALQRELAAAREASADIRLQLAAAQGQNSMIITMLDAQNKAREMSGAYRIEALRADSEISKARVTADISERVSWGNTWRMTVAKVVGVLAGIAALAGTYFLGRSG